jgi:alpha-tubulin suppressor-like RCC1 family protein
MGLTLGCRDENESPTAPDTGPAIATAAAQALSFRQVSGGWDHTCGVTTGNQAYCWGKNAAGQLGNGSTAAKSLVPVLVTELDRD